MLSWKNLISSLSLVGAKPTVLSPRPAEPGQDLNEGQASTAFGLAPRRSPAQGLRRHSRSPLRSRVMSAQLPGFRAVTVDGSVSGLLLETEGPVPPDARLSLEIELESLEAPVRAVARAIWCQQKDSKRWLVGVELCEPDQVLVELLGGLSPEARGTTPVARRARRAQLVAELRHYRFEPSALKVDIALPNGSLHSLEIPAPRSLRDNRPLAGTQLSYLDYEQSGFQAVYRLLSPWNEIVLEIQAAPSSEELWRGLPTVHSRRIRLALS